jgi:hypothetical protein
MRATKMSLLVAALSLADCAGNLACKSNTIFVSLSFSGGAEAADTLEITLSIEGRPSGTRSVAHTAGSRSGSVEIDFASAYPSGSTLSFSFVASAGGTRLAESDRTISASPNCSTLAVALDGAAQPLPDLSSFDVSQTLPDLTFRTDLASAPDLTSTADLSQISDLAQPKDLTSPVPTISITSPSAAPFYTNGTVLLQFSYSPTPDAVNVLVDAAILAAAPALNMFSLDTTSLSEGTHIINAQGSFGGMAVTSAPLTIIVDRTPPTVTKASPAPSSSNVDPAAPIQAFFSEAMLPATAISSNVTVTATPGGAVSASLALSSDGKTLTVMPTYPSPSPDSASVALGSGFTDLAGNHLAPYSWSWSYNVFQALASPITLDATHGATKPVLATDSAGKVVLGFVANDGSHNNFYVRRWNGTSWDNLGGAITANASDFNGPWGPPMIAPIAGQKLLATFAQQFSGATNASTYTFLWNGTTWSQLGAGVNGVAGAYCGYPGVVGDTSGNPVVACQELGSGINKDMWAWSWNGTTWVNMGGAVTNGTHACNTGWTGMALDSTNAPLMAYAEGNGTIQSIYVKRWNGSSWASLGTTASGTDSAGNFGFTVDSTGAPVVSYQKYDGTNYNTVVTRWNGSAWVQVGSTLMIGNGYSFLDHAPLAPLPAGNLVLASTTFQTGAGGLNGYRVYKWDGSNWTGLGGDLYGPASHYVLSAAVTIDGTGKPVTAYYDSYVTPNVISVWRYTH